PISPQQFVNSVHNAPAGYWSIAEQNNAPTMSLSAYDASFAAGLIEAAVQIHAGRKQVLLIAYDVPAPMPLWSFRPLSAAFAVAMLLTAPGLDEDIMARLDLRLGQDAFGEEATESVLDRPELESLRLGNPAARSLPILEAVACRRTADLTLASVPPQHLRVHVDPCS
ncbi:MAG: beta-ketoacyl synthase chain length factor, partial [Geminicoccaceae bacterium]